MKKCCFTIVDDLHFYPEGTHIMINSFRRFHPDIDLIVFRQDVVDRVFKEKNINFYQAKPYFAELLMNKYDLVVNMDADHIVTGRLTEVFDNVDYDVGGAWNFNDYENAALEYVKEEMYIQAGLVASTDKNFWNLWQAVNYTNAMKYLRKENDTLNLLIYQKEFRDAWRLKIFDKEKDYYGCKSLGREPLFYIENDKLMCKGEQVFAYHFARGNVFPKNNIKTMPFTDEVKAWLENITVYGQTVKISAV